MVNSDETTSPTPSDERRAARHRSVRPFVHANSAQPYFVGGT
ncbi:hypothetical protein HMPREF9440_01758 [Sutterella parvirubra YIT 11816]|uniref:Uncharacterized protein n=1 Tax=Sutterella parvirubra YIT 11816 TaxID=762967 RepID=H3KG79_9BURK|nr:hypothetical protein HMPREF9440_01758 [Sutterella parvirubra YIT 11816]